MPDIVKHPDGDGLKAISRWTHDSKYWGGGVDECRGMTSTPEGEFVRYDDVEELLNEAAPSPPLDAQALAEGIEQADLLFSGCGCGDATCAACSDARVALRAIIERHANEGATV